MTFGQYVVAVQPFVMPDAHSHSMSQRKLESTVSVNGRSAIAAADDPTNCAGTVRSVWYALTPSTDITIVVSTLASDYAADIAVYTGQRGALTPVACGFRELNFSATAGTTYYFMVTVNNGQGNLVFDVTK